MVLLLREPQRFLWSPDIDEGVGCPAAPDVVHPLPTCLRCRPASAADLHPLPTYIRCRPASAADVPPLAL